jgi:hypothetical protein
MTGREWLVAGGAKVAALGDKAMLFFDRLKMP